MKIIVLASLVLCGCADTHDTDWYTEVPVQDPVASQTPAPDLFQLVTENRPVPSPTTPSKPRDPVLADNDDEARDLQAAFALLSGVWDWKTRDLHDGLRRTRLSGTRSSPLGAWIADSVPAFELFWSTAAINDTAAMIEMQEAGEVTFVTGTLQIIRDSGLACRVRVVDGEHRGLVGWVNRGALQGER